MFIEIWLLGCFLWERAVHAKILKKNQHTDKLSDLTHWGRMTGTNFGEIWFEIQNVLHVIKKWMWNCCLQNGGLFAATSLCMMTSSNGNIFRVTGHLCEEFTGEFPSQRPATRSFDVFFDLSLNKRLSKQSWGWWFETPSRPLWRHCNGCTNLE